MIPKATEDTITILLKDKLEDLGVKVEPFPVVTTPLELGSRTCCVQMLAYIQSRQSSGRQT